VERVVSIFSLSSLPCGVSGLHDASEDQVAAARPLSTLGCALPGGDG
jgi:hypothetical protein